jgi:peroxiredoxin
VKSTQPTGTFAGKLTAARHSRVGTIMIMGVTAVVILAVTYVVNRPAANGSGLTAIALSGRASGPPPEIGKTAPDFTGTTIDGDKITLSKLRGRPAWVTFGASWCQPCRAENPDIEAAYVKHRVHRLVVLGIFIREDASTVADYATRVGLTYPKVVDTSTKIATNYRVLGIPSHFFVDPSGKLRVLKIGKLDVPAIEDAISEITNEGARPAE